MPQAVESDAHFGIGVSTLFGCAGSQVAERLYVIAERIFLFDIDRIPAEDRDDGHRHGVGVADVRRFAEKLDGIGEVEVRVLVQVFEVEQQLHPFAGIGRMRQPAPEAVRDGGRRGHKRYACAEDDAVYA